MRALRCRVDDRLLHTEVLYAELSAQRYDQLVLASRLDWVAAADVALVPAGTRVDVIAPSELGDVLENGATLVVVGTVSDLAEAVALGFSPDVAVLANRARRGDAQPLSETFWADATERHLLGELLDRGAPPLVIQRVPSQPARPLTREALSAIQDGSSEEPEATP